MTSIASISRHTLFAFLTIFWTGLLPAQDPAAEAKDEAPAAAESTKATANAALTDPAKANLNAPDQFKIKVTTTQGDFVIEVQKKWSPKGADRLYNLVKAGYFADIAFFRVIDGFMAQFGIHGNPDVAKAWQEATIQDDPRSEVSNTRGTVSFAMRGPNSRTTQLFINFGDNSRLDAMGFTPVGKVVEGMDVVDKIYSGYGEGAPRGRGPSQGRIQAEGNAYLEKDFPRLDYIKKAEIAS